MLQQQCCKISKISKFINFFWECLHTVPTFQWHLKLFSVTCYTSRFHWVMSIDNINPLEPEKRTYDVLKISGFFVCKLTNDRKPCSMASNLNKKTWEVLQNELNTIFWNHPYKELSQIKDKTKLFIDNLFERVKKKNVVKG